jgi:hypothetical protein
MTLKLSLLPTFSTNASNKKKPGIPKSINDIIVSTANKLPYRSESFHCPIGQLRNRYSF